MAKYRSYNPRQTQFFTIHPDKLLADDPLLATIDSFVEERVNLSKFSAKVKNDAGGAPAVDPRMVLKLIFYSYARGVLSSREIEERTGWDVRYVYLSAGQSLDHSTICNFLILYEQEIVGIFTQLLYVCMIVGLVDMNFIAVDGTKVKANADKEFTGTVEDFKQRKLHLEAKILERIEQAKQEEEHYRARSMTKIAQMQKASQKIDHFMAAIESDKQATDECRSLTDEDARVVKDQDRKYPGYNCQAAVDDKAHVIVATHVTNEANDAHMLPVMVREIREETGNDLKNTHLGLDSGYSNSESLRWAAEEGLTVFMPEGRGPNGEQILPIDRITSRHCKARIEGDLRILTCPGGQEMISSAAIRTSRSESYHFQPDPAKCCSCQFRERCLSRIKKTKKTFIVRKLYFDNLPLRMQMNQRLASLQGKHRMADRSCTIEHVFGEIKEWRNLRRFFHRGLKRVSLIWTIACTAYNFRKLAALRGL